MSTWLPLIAVLALSSSVAALPLRAGSIQASGLKILVIAGEDAVNIIQQKTAVAPVVEIRDRNDLPVAGVPVTFTIAGAKSASFAGGVQTITVTTNAAGRAAVSGLTPLSNGAVQINVQAAFQAQTATATITQTNFATAASAAQAGTPLAGGPGGSQGTSAGGGAGGGGGISNVAIVGIGGAAAAGGFLVLQRGDTPSAPTNAAPQIPGILVSPPGGLLNSTAIAFSNFAPNPDDDALTYAWEFGDGTTSSLARPTHIYNSEGAFTVRLTVRNATQSATNQAVVTIKSMTGRWTLGTTNNFYDLTQSASTITGTFNSPGQPPRGPVSGTVSTTSPAVRLSETNVALNGVSTFTFRGDPTDANLIIGEFNNGVTTVPGGLTRR